MSTDLKIFKTSFDISIYEIITDYDSQILKNYINDLQMPKEENVHSTFYLEKNILFNSSLNNFKNFIFSYLHIFCKNVLNKEKFIVTESWFQKYFKDYLQIIIPLKKIQFTNLNPNISFNFNWGTYYYCYKMNLPKDLIFID